MKKLLLPLLVFTLFAACKNTNQHKNQSDKKDYNQMAIDLCNCMRPLADMNEQIKSLIQEGKTQEVADLFSKVEQIAAEGEACATSLEEKYGVVAGESEQKATAALKKNCPDIAAMLERNETVNQ